MTPIHVASKDELLTALRAAKGGEEIVLADGDYGSLSLNGRWGANIFPYDSPVTITSATPGGASFSALTIAYGTNLAFSGIDVTGEFRATSSTGISLSDSTASKLSFRSVDGLDLSGNHVSGGDYTLILYSVSNFAITGNTFEKASNDLIQISRASHNGLIENNFLNDVVVTNSKAHPDLIQIFGYDGMNPHDITIRGNYLYDDPATGLNLAQGIFLFNPTGEGFRNILIEENLVSVRSPNSIFVSGGEENVIIRHNSLIAGPEGLKGGVIRLKDSTGQGFDNAGITVEDNIASRISDETGNSHVGDNFVYGSAANSPFQGNGSHWRDFLLRDPDVAPGMGAGERLQELADGENPPAAAIMAVESDADSLPLFGHEIFLGEEEGYSSLAAAPAATDSHPAATSLLLTSEEIASLPPEADFHI